MLFLKLTVLKFYNICCASVDKHNVNTPRTFSYDCPVCFSTVSE